jgi:phage-related protein
MASKNSVTLTFAGDSASLEKSLASAGSAAKDFAGKVDVAGKEAKDFGGHIDTMGEKAGDNEGKFMGFADVLDGLATTFGVDVNPAFIDGARGLADMSGGVEQLTPVLKGGVDKLKDFGGWIGSLPGKFSLATIGTKAQALATDALAGAQRLLNLVMAANPILLVVAAIGILVGAFVAAWQKSETFRDIVKGVFDAIKTAAEAVANFFTKQIPDAFNKVINAGKEIADKLWSGIKAGFDAIVGFPAKVINWIGQGIAAAADAIVDGAKKIASFIWEGIKFGFSVYIFIPSHLAQWAWTGIQAAAGAITGSAGHIADWIRDGVVGAFSKIADIGSTLWGYISTAISFVRTKLVGFFSGLGGALGTAITAGVRTVINGFIDAINAVSGVLDKAADIINDINPGPNIPNIPKIPHLAKGGIVTSPTLALIGEAGPEAVVPLSGGARGAGGVTIVVQGNTLLGSSREMARQLADILAPQLDRRITLATG